MRIRLSESREVGGVIVPAGSIIDVHEENLADALAILAEHAGIVMTDKPRDNAETR